MCPKITPNFDQALPPMKEGEHVCQILSSEIKTGRESGNAYVRWKLESQNDKRLVFYNTMMEGRAAGMFKHFVHCAGDVLYEKGEYDTDQLHGESVLCRLIINDDGYYEVKEVMKGAQKLPTSATFDDIPF